MRFSLRMSLDVPSQQWQRGGQHAGIEGLGERSHVVTAADFNGDGLLDLFLGNWADKAFAVGTHPSRIWLQQRDCGGGRPFCFSDADQLGYVDAHVDPAYRRECEQLGSDSCGVLHKYSKLVNSASEGATLAR